jgi:hypothetical protein
MIDDTLLLAGPLDAKKLVADAAIHPHHGYGGTDHAVLTTDLNARLLALLKVECNVGQKHRLRPHGKRLETPVRQADQETVQLAMSETYAGEILSLESTLRPLVDLEVQPFMQSQQQQDSATVHKLETLQGHAATETIDALATEPLTLLHNAHALALNVCQVTVSNPSGLHYRPKAVGKRRRKLMTLKKVRVLRAQARAGVADEPATS